MSLSQHISSIINEEEALLSRVLELLGQETGRKALYDGFAAEMKEIRESLPHAGVEEYPHLLTRFDLLKQQVQVAGDSDSPDRNAPYFARMVMEEDGKQHEVLVGHRAWINIEHKLVIIDWKKTPLAEVFYTCDPGDPYKINLPDGRTRQGILLERRLLTILEGQLVGIKVGNHIVSRDEDGIWGHPSQSGEDADSLSQIPRWRIKPTIQGGSISAFLDKEQYRMLQDDSAKTMIIRGGAGSGKTTVLVHRLAAIFSQDENPEEHILLVPEAGIARSCTEQLHLLGIRKVPVQALPEWTATTCRRLFRQLPHKLLHNTPVEISRFKRHPAMLTAIRGLGKQRQEELINRISLLKSIGPMIIKSLGDFSNMDAGIVLQKAKNISDSILKSHPDLKTIRGRMDDFWDEEEARLYDLNADRRELLLSKELLQQAVDASGDELKTRTIKAIIHRTVRQLASSTSEKIKTLYSDNKRDFRTLDGAEIDEGTPDDLAGTMDREDNLLLLLILKEKTGDIATPSGQLQRRSHLYLDEAQEFSPLELSLIHSLIHKGSRISLSGDFTQLMRPVTSAQNWSALLKTLNREDAVTGTLKINYRASKQIAAFNRMVLGEYAGDDIPETQQEGEPVHFTVFTDNGQRGRMMGEALIELRKQTPRATVVVIAPSPRRAKKVYQELQGIPGTRLAGHGEYDRTPGITITTVDRVKGLEFDLVILTEADEEQYPDTRLSRRRLHVAASRAMQQIWVTCCGNFSSIINPAR